MIEAITEEFADWDWVSFFIGFEAACIFAFILVMIFGWDNTK